MAAFTYSDYAFDRKTGQPITGAPVHAVRLDSTTFSAASDNTSSTGRYTLPLDTQYDYKIEVRLTDEVVAHHLTRGWAGVNLASDQTLTNNATADVTGCSITVGPGVWLAHGHGTAVGNVAGSILNLRVYDGAVEYGGGSFVQAAGTGPTGASRMSFTSSPITVAFGSTKTLKLQVFFISGSGLGAFTGILYAASQFAQVTHLRVERIG